MGLGREILRTARRFKIRGKSRSVILMYHRITEPIHDAFSLSVSPDRFAQHLDHIRNTCRAMRLGPMANAVRSGSVPPRSVVITFDDAYRCVFQNAFPLLEETKVPATVFVISGLIGNPDEFWWDVLEKILLQPGPGMVRLCIDKRERAWSITSDQKRMGAFHAIHRLLKPLESGHRDIIMDSLKSQLQVDSVGGSGNQPVGRSDLRILSQSKLIDLGVHTVSHRPLSLLRVADQKQEMIECREVLEAISGAPVDTMAYPYGDFSRRSAALAKEVGFRAACTTTPGSVVSGDDPFRLRRFKVCNWDSETFKHRLDEFFAS